MTKAPFPTKVRKTLLCEVENAFPRLYKGMCEFAFNDGSFSFVDVIEYVLQKTGRATLDISSWVASSQSTKRIEDMLEDNSINRMRFLVGDGFVVHRSKLYSHIVNTYGNVIKVTKNHAKFCIVNNDQWDFVIETSANLNKNIRLESFRITEHKGYRKFFTDVFDRFFLVDEDNFTKSMRASLE